MVLRHVPDSSSSASRANPSSSKSGGKARILRSRLKPSGQSSYWFIEEESPYHRLVGEVLFQT